MQAKSRGNIPRSNLIVVPRFQGMGTTVNELFKIGRIIVYVYGLMIVPGIAAAIGIAEVRTNRHGWTATRFSPLTSGRWRMDRRKITILHHRFGRNPRRRIPVGKSI